MEENDDVIERRERMYVQAPRMFALLKDLVEKQPYHSLRTIVPRLYRLAHEVRFIIKYVEEGDDATKV